MEALETALDSGTTDSDLKSLMDTLDAEDLFMVRRQEQRELSSFLTTRQLGSYLVFEEKFERAVRRHIESRRRSHRDRW